MSSCSSEEGARSQNPGARRVFRVFRRSFSKTNPLRRPDFVNATDFQADRMKAFELQVQRCLAMRPSWLLDSGSWLLLHGLLASLCPFFLPPNGAAHVPSSSLTI